MGHEEQRRNTEYLQAVLDAGVPLPSAHVATAAAGNMRRYWVMDPDGTALEPFVAGAALAPASHRRTGNPRGLDDLYAGLLAFHRRAAGDLLRELRYRPAPVRRKVVMHPAHSAFLRDEDHQEEDSRDLSR